MADVDISKVVVRVFQRPDRPQIEAFRCAPYGEKWCEAAEKVIREAPGAIASGEYSASIAVAVAGDTIIGVVVFGFEPGQVNEVVIFSLGVRIELHHQGIGTRLKQAIMAAAVSEDHPAADH